MRPLSGVQLQVLVVVIRCHGFGVTASIRCVAAMKDRKLR